MLTLGTSAVEALAYLIDSHLDIATVRCVEYSRGRISDDHNQEKKIPPSQDVTERRLRHLVQDRKWHWLWRDDAVAGKLQERIYKLPVGRALAVTSRVTLHDHRKRHIPMVDFRCEPSYSYLKHITEWMSEIDDAGGMVLQTINSYHYYGFSLLTDRQWEKFVGHSLLLVPDVDVRYLGHRLIEGWGCLRISRDPCAGTSCNEPEVVNIVEATRR